MLNTSVKLFFSLFFITALSATLFAQQQEEAIEVSEEELEMFVDAQMMIQEMNEEVQPKMLETIQKYGFEPQRYIELNQADEMGQEMDADTDEVERYQQVKESIMDLQQEANEQIAESIEEMGFDMERYSEINMAVQRDPELQQKMMEMMQ
jgi:hypothetical protein